MIALTSKNGPIKQRCFAAGMNDFISKPTNKEILKQALSF
ncbi:hypothetical protein B1F79_03715 [Coxiella-like endosymbiont of Rhipicephalus sanguineus]|nr:hypothetical protein [Coxiella-like endosymbiont of Rhipicephalus sanguineus]